MPAPIENFARFSMTGVERSAENDDEGIMTMAPVITATAIYKKFGMLY